jgi:hypothetical protein
VQLDALIVKLAPGSQKIVIGLPAVPEPWAVKGLVIVPHRLTVVPGPIWAEPVPQLLDELKKDTGYASLQPLPLSAPAAV